VKNKISKIRNFNRKYSFIFVLGIALASVVFSNSSKSFSILMNLSTTAFTLGGLMYTAGAISNN